MELLAIGLAELAAIVSGGIGATVLANVRAGKKESRADACKHAEKLAEAKATGDAIAASIEELKTDVKKVSSYAERIAALEAQAAETRACVDKLYWALIDELRAGGKNEDSLHRRGPWPVHAGEKVPKDA